MAARRPDLLGVFESERGSKSRAVTFGHNASTDFIHGVRAVMQPAAMAFRFGGEAVREQLGLHGGVETGPVSLTISSNVPSSKSWAETRNCRFSSEYGPMA